MKKKESKQKKSSELRKKAEKKLKPDTTSIEKLSEADVRKLAHELQVHQVELEIQNDELRKAQIEIEVSREKYSDLYDFAPVGYFTISEKGLILEANLTGASILGVERSLLIKEPLSKFVAREDQDIYYLHRRNVFEKRDKQTCELKMLKKDNTHFYAQLESIAVKDSDGNFNKHRVVISDISERKLAIDALRESEEKYRDLLENANDLIQSVKPDGGFIYVNRKWKETLGYNDEEIAKLTLFDILHYDSPSNCLEALKHISNGEIVDRIETIFIAKDGRKINVEGSVNCIFKERKPVATRVIFRNITERKKAEEQVVEKSKEIERINKELNDFVFIISHDLKEPLISIEGYTSKLSRAYENIYDEKAKYYVNRITENIGVMSNRIYDIMDVIKVGMVEYNFTDNNSGDIVNDVVNEMESKIENNKIKVTIQDNLPRVVCDRKRLRDVFSNLISNAIKFDNNQRHVQIGCEREGEYYRFFVEDTGIGVQKEHQELIFKIFKRLKDIDTEGTGVGLAIAKKIVELHKGKIWVQSPVKDGRGTRFCFTIPISKK